MKIARTIAVTAAFGTALAFAPTSPAAAEARSICYPVAGGSSGATWTDTFGAPRGDGTRAHEGQDLMSVGGQKMRPLLSAVDGTVRELVYQNDKGNRLVVQDDDGWFYVYIHVNNDTPGTDDGQATRDQVFPAGLEVGDRVSRCETISYMGDSGNAEGTGAHVHFEIRRPLTGGDASRSWAWSSAEPINPADSLRAATTADGSAVPQPSSGTSSSGTSSSGTSSSGTSNFSSSSRWTPFSSVGALVDRQYRDFYGRAPDSGGATYWANRLSSGVETPASFIGKLLAAPEFEARVAPVARLYWAYFDRIPDTDGLLYWIHEVTDGAATLGEVSDAFAASAEFRATYGSLSDADFVGLVYRNVLDREADAGGRSYWSDRLAGGLRRGDVMIGFSESPEYRGALADEVRVVLAYVAMLERSPDQGGLEYWSARGAGGLVTGIYASDEYRARIRSL